MITAVLLVLTNQLPLPEPEVGDITMGDEEILWGDEDTTFED